MTESSCEGLGKLNYEECRCIPDQECDSVKDCPLGQIWDNSKCECIKIECPGFGQCSDGQAFDSNCECQCIANENSCDGFFDHFTCSCVSNVCDFVEKCPLGMRWDDEICHCVDIDCANTDCPKNFVFDETCMCQCGLSEQSCQPFEKFSKEDCTCYPHFACDIVHTCPLGESWDGSDDVCACVPNECESERPCLANYLFDEKCECQCRLSQDVCDEEYSGTKFIGCECRDCTERSCPIGQIWNFDTCSCVSIL